MPDNTVMPIVRVAVLAAGDGADGAGRLTEMALPAELPLREIIPAVQRTVLPTADASEGAPGAAEPRPDRRRTVQPGRDIGHRRRRRR